MKIHLPSVFRLGRLLMSLLHALQSKITEARAAKSTAAKNMSLHVTSLINGCVMVPAMQTTRTVLRRAERR
jgi:cob(I)alamin adenosyltransferase